MLDLGIPVFVPGGEIDVENLKRWVVLLLVFKNLEFGIFGAYEHHILTFISFLKIIKMKYC